MAGIVFAWAVVAVACGGSEVGPRTAVDGAPRDGGHPQPASSVSSTSDRRGTTYSTAEGPCRVTWVVATEGIDRGFVAHRPDCPWPPAGQARLIGRILDAIGREPAVFQSLRTLGWGRLHPDGAQDATFPTRLAVAALRTPAWDGRAGRPVSGDINGFVKHLANEAGVFGEIQSVFAARGLTVAVTSVEKVLTSRTGDLPYLSALVREGASPSARVPWDAQVWFSIRRAVMVPEY
jgi:hypothetical protein